jgi:hypothetical protein
MTKNTRILLDRQRKAYQILVAKLRQEVRRLKFQRNSLMDPLLEMQYYPYLPRTPNTKSALKPLLGTIGQLATKSTDYFVLNPPPAVGDPNESNKFEGFFNGNTLTLKDKPSTKNSKQSKIALGDRVSVMVNGERCLGKCTMN